MSSVNSMSHYNVAVVERLCDSLNVPTSLDHGRLYNVSFDLSNQAIKLYFLDADNESLIKIDAHGMVSQYLAEPSRFDPNLLFSRLGQEIDLREIVPDTMENERLYLYIEPAEAGPFVSFLHCFARCHGVSDEYLMDRINTIAGRHITGFRDAHKKRAISLVRIALDGAQGGKLYARPWLHGEGHPLCAASRDFLCQLYGCGSALLDDHLHYAWVSIDVETGRLVVATQHHQLLHGA